MTHAREPHTTGDEDQPSELEGGGTGQNWGQGEGMHEPTIPAKDEQPDAEEPLRSFPDGTAADLGDASQPLAREDEGMDR